MSVEFPSIHVSSVFGVFKVRILRESVLSGEINAIMSEGRGG